MTDLANLQFEVLSATRADLGESPVWSAEDNSIWWVDIDGKRLLQSFVADGRTTAWEAPERVGFVVLTDTGAVVVGMETGLFRFDRSTGTFDLIGGLPAEKMRFNDATVDNAGRLWAGTMDMDNGRSVGVLYRIGPDLKMRPMIDGLMTVNGLAIDASRRRLYISDSHPTVQTIWTADYDPTSGAIGAREVFVSMAGFNGRPDGAALDRDGNYWIAGVGGGVLQVFAPDGSHLFEIATPLESPTKQAIGGPNLDQLYLTSKGGHGINGKLLRVADMAGHRGRPVPAAQLGF